MSSLGSVERGSSLVPGPLDTAASHTKAHHPTGSKPVGNSQMLFLLTTLLIQATRADGPFAGRLATDVNAIELSVDFAAHALRAESIPLSQSGGKAELHKPDSTYSWNSIDPVHAVATRCHNLGSFLRNSSSDKIQSFCKKAEFAHARRVYSSVCSKHPGYNPNC